MPTFVIHQEEVPEQLPVDGYGLGRHILHDSRLGACTGFAETGALGSEGLYETVAPITGALGLALDNTFGIGMYHYATLVDPFSGEYPPTDTGSNGLSVNKAAASDQNPCGRQLISGYQHALSVDEMINGLQVGAGVIGINWYSSFDQPDNEGNITITPTARVRGGHELHALNVDMELERFEIPNSWGTGYGKAGVCYLSFGNMDRLFSEDGDATFPVPLAQPAPTPTPIPASVSKLFTPDQFSHISDWAEYPHVWHKATVAARDWKAAPQR